jgi:tubulin beta
MGCQFSVEDAMVAVQEKNSDFFVEWIPNSVMTSLCQVPPHGMKSSLPHSRHIRSGP